MILTFAFFIVWLPVAVTVALDFLTHTPSFDIILAHVASAAAIINSTVNPFLIIGLDKRYQSVFKAIIERFYYKLKNLFH